jgi:hypothetical protein
MQIFFSKPVCPLRAVFFFLTSIGILALTEILTLGPNPNPNRNYNTNPNRNYNTNPNPTINALFTSFYFLRNGYTG